MSCKEEFTLSHNDFTMEESHLKQQLNFGDNKYFSGLWKDKNIIFSIY